MEDRAEVRSERIPVACTAAEKEEIRARAEASGAESIGRYLVECAIGVRSAVPPKKKKRR